MSDIYRLAKPRKKGLLSLLFSRFFVIVLLLLAQVFLALSFYTWLKDLLPFFSVIWSRLSLSRFSTFTPSRVPTQMSPRESSNTWVM